MQRVLAPAKYNNCDTNKKEIKKERKKASSAVHHIHCTIHFFSFHSERKDKRMNSNCCSSADMSRAVPTNQPTRAESGRGKVCGMLRRRMKKRKTAAQLNSHQIEIAGRKKDIHNYKESKGEREREHLKRVSAVANSADNLKTKKREEYSAKYSDTHTHTHTAGGSQGERRVAQSCQLLLHLGQSIRLCLPKEEEEGKK